MQCINLDACLGDNNNEVFVEEMSSGICDTGYTGALCNECSSGYGKVSEKYCYSCS